MDVNALNAGQLATNSIIGTGASVPVVAKCAMNSTLGECVMTILVIVNVLAAARQ